MVLNRVLGFRIDIIVEPDEYGFHAYCPALKGLHVHGNTTEEARDNAKEAAIAYLQSLMKHGDPIPVGIVVVDVQGSEDTQQKSRGQITHHTENLEIACPI